MGSYGDPKAHLLLDLSDVLDDVVLDDHV